MFLSIIKNLLPAPKDGLDAASAVFSPPVIWVEADKEGKCIGNQTWSVVPTIHLNGRTIACTSVNIESVPSGVRAAYGNGIITVSVQDATAAVSYVGEIKVSMSSTLDGKRYNVTKSIPVQDKRRGGDGKDSIYYELVPSENILIADYQGHVLTGNIYVDAYKVVGNQRSALPLGRSTTTDGLYHWIQYRQDGGSWRIAEEDGTIISSSVRQTLNTLELRLVCYEVWGGSSPRVLITYPALKVVNHGAPGQAGGTGKTGPWWMPQGSWDSDITYERTDDVIPIVEHNGEYWYIANGNTVVHGDEPTASSTKWEKADRFRIVFLEALFAAYAKLGSAIMNGHWIMSQYGTVNGGVSNNYRLFNDTDPEGKEAGHFCPNWAVDLFRGKSYMNDSVVRGVLKVRAIYTITGILKTVNNTKVIDLENNPGNSYVIPGNEKVSLPDPTNYEGLTLTILFRAGGILTCSSGIYTAYYTVSTITSAPVESGMSVIAFHSNDNLAVLTIQAIRAYGPNEGVRWVVVAQRGVLGIRFSAFSTEDNHKLLPDGRLLT